MASDDAIDIKPRSRQVTDGIEALAHLSAHKVDAVVMDVMMPRLDGLETTRMLRQQGNDVPILVLTARDAVGDRVDGLDAGADDYMAKPFALDELMARLRALTRRSRPDAEDAPAAGGEVLSFDDLRLDREAEGLEVKPIAVGQYRAFAVMKAHVSRVGVVAWPQRWCDE